LVYNAAEFVLQTCLRNWIFHQKERDMNNLNRVRYVTQNYTNLQGLRWVIWGIMALAVAAEDGGWLSTAVLLLIVIPLFLLLFWLGGVYYQHEYGQVNQTGGEPNTFWQFALLVATAVTSFFVDRVFQLPVYIAPLVFAAGLAVMAWRERPFRWHYLVVAVLVAGTDLFVPVTAVQPGVFLWALSGVSIIIIGLCDHLLLRRTFPAIAEEDTP
jgi:hypothetical protein